jgi:hypothetical protein
MLDTLRASGRQVFLATNSLWDYTHIVMNFLLHGRTGAARNHDWLEYFDVVITGAPARPDGGAQLGRPGLCSDAPRARPRTFP